MTPSVVPLPEDQISGDEFEAKLLAVRWDLIKWCLVLDLDVRLSEGKDAPMYRAWLIFDGMHEITWRLERARLPEGCWVGPCARIEPMDKDFSRFSISALTPDFDENDELEEHPPGELEICAKRIHGIRTVREAMPGEFGLDEEQRNALAEESDLLEAAKALMGSS